MNAAQRLRAQLLKCVAPPKPGVYIDSMWDGLRFKSVLCVVATGRVRAKVDGHPAADVDHRLVVYDGQRLVRHHVAGVFIAAIHAVDGMLVRTGKQHYLIVNGDLAAIDRAAYGYLLGLRTAAAVAATKGAASPVARAASAHTSPTTNAPGGAS